MYVCDLATFLIEAGVVIQHHRVNVCLCYSVENSDGNLDKKKLRKIGLLLRSSERARSSFVILRIDDDDDDRH